jgi:oligopeptide transport system substrate-binding protein
MYFKKFMGGIVAVGLVLAACSSPGTSAGPTGSEGPGESTAPAADQVLRVNMSQEPPHLDPTLADDSISIQVLRSITLPLAYYNADLEVVPGLADSWDVSADGKEITFHLGDHKYSNGEDIIAADFVTSYRRLADPRIAASYSYSLEPVVGWSELQEIDITTATADADVEAGLDALGVAAPDDKTFVVTLKRAASYFVYIAAGWFSAPEKEDFDYSEAETYVSSGPMMIAEWRHNSNIKLVPNPEWNGEPVTIDEIDLAMINDPTASLAAYEADELDVTGVPRAEVNRVKEDPVLSGQIREGDVLSIAYFGFDLKNPNGPFTKSVLLRKAFNEALDKDTMLATIFSGIGTVAYSLVPPGMPGHQEDQFIPFDATQAKADFDEAVAALGTTADALNLELGYNVAGNNEDLAVYFQEQWRTVFGIEVKLTSMGDFGAYLDRLTQDPFDIFRLGWGADYPHPNNFLTDLISCTSGNNNMGYCNPAVDALLEQASSLANLEDQVPLYNEAQEMVMADAPIIPQTFGARFTLVKPWVQNLVLTAQDSNSGELFYAWTSIAAH